MTSRASPALVLAAIALHAAFRPAAAAPLPIPQPGRWHRIDALTDFQKITLEDDFDVPAR